MKLPSIFGTMGSRDKPKDSYGGQAYSFFFGRNTSGKNVNERTAMQTIAELLAIAIRRQWHIQNNLHWTLDVVFREDSLGSKEKKAAHNLG